MIENNYKDINEINYDNLEEAIEFWNENNDKLEDNFGKYIIVYCTEYEDKLQSLDID